MQNWNEQKKANNQIPYINDEIPSSKEYHNILKPSWSEKYMVTSKPVDMSPIDDEDDSESLEQSGNGSEQNDSSREESVKEWVRTYYKYSDKESK